MQRPREHRRLRRWELIYYLRVFDRITGHLIGHLVDVSAGGVKLVHERPMADGAALDAFMEAWLDGEGKVTVPLHLRLVWSRPDSNPALTLAGFELLDPAPADVEIIERLIAELKLPDEADGGLVLGDPAPQATRSFLFF